MTFFDTHPASFHTCSILNDQVETLPFLAAAEVLAQLLGKGDGREGERGAHMFLITCLLSLHFS